MKKKIFGVMIPIIIGTLAFLTVYGVTPLNVTNDKWIIAGYDEFDIIQHYCGWVGFRYSDWSFPLGLAANIDVPTGTIISFTDSIPWVAIFFKIFRGILPKTFQYFGLYALLCYILQSVAAFRIIFYKTKNPVYSSIGCVLFSFAPIMLERMMRHTALGSQWLILFAILIWMKHRDKFLYRDYVYYLLLLVLAIGIHPYFLPMIAGFMFISAISDIRAKRFWTIALFFGNLIITYLTGYLIGVLGSGVTPSRGGYGYFSMNLNAIINPTSAGGYVWSDFMKVRQMTLGNYDGFNYLGAGVLVGSVIAIVLIAIFFDKKIIASGCKRYMGYAFLMICFTLFAISNVVTFNSRILFEIPLPESISYLCGIFRASSRMFYPVYYSIFLFIILALWKVRDKVNSKSIYCILIFIVLLQLFDIRYCLIEKHQVMVQNGSAISILDDPHVGDIFRSNTDVLIDRFSGNKIIVGVAALSEDCDLHYTFANTADFERSEADAAVILDGIKQTGDIGSYVIVTTDMNCLAEFLSFENIGYYEIGGNYFLCDISRSEYVINPFTE